MVCEGAGIELYFWACPCIDSHEMFSFKLKTKCLLYILPFNEFNIQNNITIIVI